MRAIGQVMTSPAKTIWERASGEEALRVMESEQVRHLPIVDRAGKVVGMLGDMAVQAAVRTGQGRLPASHLAAPCRIVTRAGDPVIPTLHRQLAQRVEAVVVVDRARKPVGIFTEHDALVLGALVIAPWRTVGEVVLADPTLCVAPDVLAADALRWMTSGGVRHLVVAEDARLIGVVSVRDLVGASNKTVADLAHDPVHTCRLDTPLAMAVRLMVRERVGCLPAVGSGRAVEGVLTRTDVMRELVRHLVKSSPVPAPRRKSA